MPFCGVPLFLFLNSLELKRFKGSFRKVFFINSTKEKQQHYSFCCLYCLFVYLFRGSIEPYKQRPLEVKYLQKTRDIPTNYSLHTYKKLVYTYKFIPQKTPTKNCFCRTNLVIKLRNIYLQKTRKFV